VFGLKVVETYVSSALVPTVVTLPVLAGLGAARDAPWSYYPTATVAVVLALFALPVAIGALLALVLMRVAPAGRVKEAATALSVVLAAGLVFACGRCGPSSSPT
jgi:ABC-2 type transport system permease protein